MHDEPANEEPESTVEILSVDRCGVPDPRLIQNWALTALEHDVGELAIRIVDMQEMRELNREFAGKDRPTNVLSFPFTDPDMMWPAGSPEKPLGDIAICDEVVAREAAEQNKPLHAHWAHMVVHGVLHLRGYDHQSESDAAQMEQREIQILSRVGFADPYRCDNGVTTKV